MCVFLQNPDFLYDFIAILNPFLSSKLCVTEKRTFVNIGKSLCTNERLCCATLFIRPATTLGSIHI